MVDQESSPLERFNGNVGLLVRNLIDFVFPSRCPLCFRPTRSPDPASLCPSCLSEVTFIGPPYCPKCGIPFASQKEESHLCGWCLRQTTAYGVARAVCTFSGSIRTAVHAFKYQNRTYLGKTLIGLMERNAHRFSINRYDTLVPVPLHKNRLKERGYNQSLLLAREMACRHGLSVEPGMLERITDSVPQIALAGARRRENVKGVFSLRGDSAGRRILLIDDVLTTGATVNECAKILQRGKARKVDVFTIARTV
jgi:ComF family protein